MKVHRIWGMSSVGWRCFERFATRAFQNFNECREGAGMALSPRTADGLIKNIHIRSMPGAEVLLNMQVRDPKRTPAR